MTDRNSYKYSTGEKFARNLGQGCNVGE